jgi:hypothetical protein
MSKVASAIFNGVKAYLIFAVMVATPLVVHNLYKGKGLLTDTLLPSWTVIEVMRALYAVLLLFLLGYTVIYLLLSNHKLDFAINCLKSAERDLNDCLSSGMEHGGRKGRVKERYEWNRLVKNPVKQALKAGFQTVAHDLVKANEDEVQGKRKSMGKASTTAFLLRELYEGDVMSAQRKIFADTKNGDRIPYVAPGIRELVDFEHFDKQNGFPPGSGVSALTLKMAVLLGRFPKYLIMVKTAADDKKTVLRGWDVIKELTQQRPPQI